MCVCMHVSMCVHIWCRGIKEEGPDLGYYNLWDMSIKQVRGV